MEAKGLTAWQVAQEHELKFWSGEVFTSREEWGYYEEFFGPYFQDRQFEVLCEVGSGPTPFMLNPIVQARCKIAVDPLMPKYMELPRYWHTLFGIYGYATHIEDLPDNFCDGLVAFNVLDHVEEPLDILKQMYRVLRSGGVLYLHVDVDKPADHLHPHSLNCELLMDELEWNYQKVESRVIKSWKFKNKALQFMGRKP